MKGVRDYLSWVETILKLPVEARLKMVDAVLNAIASYRDKIGEKTAEQKYLSDILRNEDEVELIGFSVNTMYVKAVSEFEDELDSIFVHPWGTPVLTYKHKRLPIVFLVGPGVRFNESVLDEVKGNKRVKVRGITG